MKVPIVIVAWAYLASIVLTIAPPAARCCPSCKQQLQDRNFRRHLAFCSPDLLDPQGWKAGDQKVVLDQVSALHQKSSPKWKALQLRFGQAPVTSQQKLAERMGWSPRRTRDTISQLLHSIPPVSEDAPLDVLFEDAHFIAANKPAGVGVTPAHRLRGGSVLNRIISHLKLSRKDAARVPAPCHRLDLETSGVLLYAKTKDAATNLMKQFEEHKVKKSYAALCTSIPSSLTIKADICKVPGATRAERRICEPGETGGQKARSTLSVVAAAGKNGPCLVLVQPDQGRTHQIRVHCKALGAPLVGDELYGGFASSDAGARAKLTRHALHAQTLQFFHPSTRKRMTISAPLPDDIQRAASALGIKLHGKLGR